MPFEEPVGKMLFWPKKRPKDSEFRETNDDEIGGFLFSLSSIFFSLCRTRRGDDERGEDFSDQFWKWDGNKLLKAPLLAFTRTLDVRRA